MKTFFEKEMEEFDKKFVIGYEGEYLSNFKPNVTHDKIKSFIASSHKRLLDEVIERVKGKKDGIKMHLYECYCPTCKSADGWNEALTVIISDLQALKDQIK